jgi:hypothetical protein
VEWLVEDEQEEAAEDDAVVLEEDTSVTRRWTPQVQRSRWY